jgi:hypothetical protein
MTGMTMRQTRNDLVLHKGDAKRKVSSSKIGDVDAKVTGEHRIELDSHADQSCVGDNATVLYEWPDSTVEVGPFLDALGCVKSAPIVTAAVVYDDSSTGKSILMIIHQAIFIKGLEHNILCPMQMRHSGVTLEVLHANSYKGGPCHHYPGRKLYMIPLSISGGYLLLSLEKANEEGTWSVPGWTVTTWN